MASVHKLLLAALLGFLFTAVPGPVAIRFFKRMSDSLFFHTVGMLFLRRHEGPEHGLYQQASQKGCKGRQEKHRHHKAQAEKERQRVEKAQNQCSRQICQREQQGVFQQGEK